MTLEERHRQGSSRIDLVFVACPKCNAPLDTPLRDGGAGTEFPQHWRYRCPANPAVGVEEEADQ